MKSTADGSLTPRRSSRRRGTVGGACHVGATEVEFARRQSFDLRRNRLGARSFAEHAPRQGGGIRGQRSDCERRGRAASEQHDASREDAAAVLRYGGSCRIVGLRQKFQNDHRSESGPCCPVGRRVCRSAGKTAVAGLSARRPAVRSAVCGRGGGVNSIGRVAAAAKYKHCARRHRRERPHPCLESMSATVTAAAPPAPPPHPVTDAVRAALATSLRGCDELLPEAEWLAKLARAAATGQPLRIKFGLDPTAPDLHLGHTVVLQQDAPAAGSRAQVIFLIGDFTSMIGDPSGRNTTRPPLTREQIEANAADLLSTKCESGARPGSRPRSATTPNGATRSARAA